MQTPACYHDARTKTGCVDCDANERFLCSNWPTDPTHSDDTPYPVEEAIAIARGTKIVERGNHQ